MNRRRLPKYVSEFQDRHGKWRVRFRRKGFADYYFRSSPWSAEFMQQYQSCLNGETSAISNIGATRTKTGTINALSVAFYGSPEFLGTAPSTQKQKRHVIERFRAAHGDKRVATFERKHIKAIIGSMHKTPAAANNLLDCIRLMMAFAVDIDLRKDNPAIGLKGFPESKDGFHTWTDTEIAQYEARHPTGMARLALALLLYTSQRRSDVVRMGWQHVSDDVMRVVQQKTGTALTLPIHPALAAVLRETPRDNLTFLITSFGKPFTSNGFGNWFRDRCNEAGLPRCSAHGLRKAAARRLAEAGRTNQQIKSVTGHRTDAEVSRYTREADQPRLAKQALGIESEQKLSNQNKG